MSRSALRALPPGLLLCAGLLAACNQSQVNTPIRSFDRPSDVALACAQYDPNRALYNARPLSDCRAEGRDTRTIVDANGQSFPPSLRALVTNSARGELALVDADLAGIVDVNPAVPGFGFLPVGRLPEEVRASEDGCRAVTVNVDSCDLGVVDLPQLYNLRIEPFRDGGSPQGTAGVVRRLQPAVGGRPLGARPTQLAISPSSRPGLHGFDPGGTPGQCVGGSYRAWVALPGCELVVEVDLDATTPDPSGVLPAEVLRAIRVTRSGAEVISDPAQLATLSCPSECGGGARIDADGGVGQGLDAGVGADGGDAGAANMSRLPTEQALPGALALDLEDGLGRLFIGDLSGERVVIVPLDPLSGATGELRAVTLEAGALGTSRLRVSPRSEAGKFLYAVARDASVRVIDLDRELECETNPDPTAFASVSAEDPFPTARRFGCLPLGDPATPPRSPLATSPGIELPGRTLPRDVAFVHLDLPPPGESNVVPPSAGPGLLVGDFAWIIGSDGRATLINLFDACPQPNQPQGTGPFTPACELGNAAPSRATTGTSNFGNPQPLELDRLSHRRRAGSARFQQPANQQDTGGAPRVQDPTQPFAVTGGEATDGGVAVGPSLVAVPLPPELDPSGVVSQSVAFPDPDRARSEVWTLSWEGVIPGTERSQGILGGGRLVDPGGVFCSRGVRAGDKLALVGCQDDADCGFLQRCGRDPAAAVSVTTGLCLDVDVNGELPKTLIQQCGPLLRAERRYRIASARQGVSLDGGLRTDVLELAEIYEPEHPAETRVCMSDTDCSGSGGQPAVVVSGLDGAGSAVELPTRCLEDSDGVRRCLRACELPGGADPKASLCGAGFQCAATRLAGGSGELRCLRAPLDDALIARCVRERRKYQVRAGDAFLAVGAVSGMLTELQPNPATGECEIPPVSSERVRLNQSRLPLDPPLCPPLATPLDQVGPGTPNACLVPDTPEPVVHFENPVLRIALSLPAMQPVPPDGLALSFSIVGGGVPLQAGLASDVAAQDPRAAVTAPDGQTVFVVDQGKQTTATGLRGQLLRLSSVTQTVDRGFIVR